ncbi:hypothetical protein ALC57_17007 [Trachymyrmex cornetzi]|uniref:Uncharacterized protein n=1 Tax=Trachymyrmex cornetzi TaxID=471704 RepID=A0A195DDA1_9HYME|nr:hypothetical protein ALC57_17007 [Trachymyrmex cornetzi]
MEHAPGLLDHVLRPGRRNSASASRNMNHVAHANEKGAGVDVTFKRSTASLHSSRLPLKLCAGYKEKADDGIGVKNARVVTSSFLSDVPF